MAAPKTGVSVTGVGAAVETAVEVGVGVLDVSAGAGTVLGAVVVVAAAGSSPARGAAGGSVLP